MKTKTIFILSLLCGGLCCVRANGQQAIETLIPRIEKISESPPQRNTVETRLNIFRRQEDGTVLAMRKHFLINDFPNLVEELIQAFNQEKEHAQSVSESMVNGKVFRRYIFTQNGMATNCMLNGTMDKMIFIYQSEPASAEPTEAARMSNEERFFRGLPPE